jgi:hypothetical protein
MNTMTTDLLWDVAGIILMITGMIIYRKKYISSDKNHGRYRFFTLLAILFILLVSRFFL